MTQQVPAIINSSDTLPLAVSRSIFDRLTISSILLPTIGIRVSTTNRLNAQQNNNISKINCIGLPNSKVILIGFNTRGNEWNNSTNSEALQFRKRCFDMISDSVVPSPREELETPTFGFRRRCPWFEVLSAPP